MKRMFPNESLIPVRYVPLYIYFRNGKKVKARSCLGSAYILHAPVFNLSACFLFDNREKMSVFLRHANARKGIPFPPYPAFM